MRPGAGRPSAAVLVRLAIFRRVEVNYALDALDVDAAGGNIGRHQRHAAAVDEARHRPVTLVLAESAVDCSDLKTGSSQFLTNSVNSTARAAENHAAPALLHGSTSQPGFAGVVDRPEEMLHAFHADFLRPDFDFEGMVLVFTDQDRNFIVEGRAEEECLPLPGTIVQDMAHRVDESHISHAVGFIDDHGFYVIQFQHSLFHQVNQATGTGDDNLDTLLKPLALLGV